MTRKHLALGCVFMILANMIVYLGITFAAIVVDDIPIMTIFNMIPTYGIPCLLWFYYRMICMQWTELGDRVGAAESAQRNAAEQN